MISIVGVVAPGGLDGPKVKAFVVGPISWWVESYMRPVGPYLDRGLRTDRHRLGRCCLVRAAWHKGWRLTRPR